MLSLDGNLEDVELLSDRQKFFPRCWGSGTTVESAAGQSRGAEDSTPLNLVVSCGTLCWRERLVDLLDVRVISMLCVCVEI